MKTRSRWLAPAIIIVAAAIPAFATGGAWTRDEGGYYVKIGLTSLTADEEYGFDGNRRLIFHDTTQFGAGDYGVTDITLYGEYGITGWLTGVASTQYKVAVKQAEYKISGRDTSASASGLGDLWLGARFKLPSVIEPVVAAFTLSLKLPTGTPLQEIPLGTGVIDYEAALAIGSGFPIKDEINGYAQLSAGYRLRNSASNELNYQAEIGVNLSEVLMVQGIFDGSHSSADFQEAANEAITIGRAEGYESDQSFTRWGFGIIYRTSETMDLSLGYSWNSSGRNALASSGVSIGVAWRK